MPEVLLEEAERFMVDSLRAMGAPESEAKAHADLLIHADAVGHFSHGINRLELYLCDIMNGAAKPSAKPRVLNETAATAWVDGCNALGATVGNFCMDIAIKKAKKCGVGWVAAKRCNHYGMAGYWALKAEKEGLIGMSFTNSAPTMVPTRAEQSALGTNPIAMAASATKDDSLVVDLATTTAAMGKIEILIHKSEPVPEGWALGPDGKTTTDPQVAYDTARLLPLGGFEETCGYKGYGLATMVETFTSGLSGSNPSHQVPMWTKQMIEPPNLGQCFVAVDPNCFAPGFGERIAECLQHWRNLKPVDPSLPVLAPGDKERMNAEVAKEKGTVTYVQRQIVAFQRIANMTGVRPMAILKD